MIYTMAKTPHFEICILFEYALLAVRYCDDTRRASITSAPTLRLNYAWPFSNGSTQPVRPVRTNAAEK